MKKLLTLGTICLLASACHKDKNSSSNGNGKQLTMAIDSVFENGTLAGVDTTNFSYDGKGNLLTRHSVYDSADISVREDFTYTRDSKGRTTKIDITAGYFENGVAPFPGGEGITEVYYQSGSDQIQYLYSYDAGDGRSEGDSVLYDYTGGKLTASRVYHITSSGPAELTATNTWSLNDAGELTAFSLNSTDESERIDYTLTYDGKINPVQVGLEEINSAYASVSPDNVAKQVAHSLGDETTTTVNSNYTYDSDGRPVSLISGDTAGSIVRHTHYFYQ